MKLLLSNTLVFLNALAPAASAHPGHEGDVDTLAVAFIFMMLGILLSSASVTLLGRRKRFMRRSKQSDADRQGKISA